MPLTYFWMQAQNPMADKLNDRIQQLRDESDVRYYEPYANAAALFFYKEDYQEITKAVKYRSALRLGRHMGRELGRRLAESEVFRDVDLVIPVPLHWMRKFSRGYNQAAVIAESLASSMGVAFDADVLERVRRTRTQTRLDVGAKASNVSGAFAVRKACSQEGRGLLSSASHILILDDVFTTGSTLAECCRTLREVLPPSRRSLVRISVCTLAAVGE